MAPATRSEPGRSCASPTPRTRRAESPSELTTGETPGSGCRPAAAAGFRGGRASSRGLAAEWLLVRSPDHVLGRLNRDGTGGDLGAEPVQQQLHIGRGDGVSVAAVADVVEGQLHPPAAILLSRGDVSLDGRNR